MLLVMKRITIASWILAAFGWLPAGAYAQNCSNLPTSFPGGQFPKGNFLSNFNNNCYLLPFSSGHGGGTERGDMNSVYYKMFFNINSPNIPPSTIPPYEIIIVGAFQNSRYFSIATYDDHSAITQNLTDVNIVPLTAGNVNPYQPGVAYVSGQHYGAAIHLGGTPGNLQPGCMMTGNNIEANSFDGTQRHAYMDWNLDPPFLQQPVQYKLHEVDTPGHTNPNTAGVIIVRNYLDLTVGSPATDPHVIIRDVASGCAYPAAYIISLGNVVTPHSKIGNTWQNQQQVQEHNVYANWQSTDCWGTIPSPYNYLQWLREDEYIPGANPDAGYLITTVPAGLPQSIFNANEVMRIRFRVPTTPPTPCVNGCSRSGSEQMRYLSISFEAGASTLASLPDSCPSNPLTLCTPLVQDPNGYVSLIVGTGVPQPSVATPANGYTWLDLSKTGSTYLQLNEIAIRHILASSGFDCATQGVPYKTGEATTEGAGLIGLYSPLVDYPPADALPATAIPASSTGLPGTCAVFPSGPPMAITPSNARCGVVFPAPATTITALTTQCTRMPDNPDCNEVYVQPSPPIAIVGSGFGSFPPGLPYNGNSNFVQITDTTQNWSAGFTGNSCTVSIGEWSDSLISLIANVNQNGVCPMAAGDNLAVTVWNPQTLASAQLSVTVQAQTAGEPRKP
jgi:hypothetical protein